MSEDVIYCYKCKKYIITDDVRDSQGFARCPKCLDVAYSILSLTKDNNENMYYIEIQDELIIPFKNRTDFNNLIKKMYVLLKKGEV